MRITPYWLLCGACALLPIRGLSAAAIAQKPAIELPVDQTTSYKGEEYLLLGNAVRGAGEPVIAINPTDPNNIIVGAMGNLNYVEGEHIGTGRQRVAVADRVTYRNTPGASISVYAVSQDRGRTWRFFEDKFRDQFKMNGTADAFVGAGKDGTLFMGAMNFFPMNATPEMRANEVEPRPGLLYGATDLSVSTDEGKTWSVPKHVMGQATPAKEYAAGTKPEFLGKTPYDRPFLVTDLSTGTIYVPGNGSGGDPVHRETFFRASRNNGKTWGLIYSYDSPDYPQGGSGARPAAANGVLGLAYVASAAPDEAAGKCPCVIFAASHNEGKTFERHVVKDQVFVQRGFGGMGSPSVAADPSRPGRFAVMILTEGNTAMQIYVTDDNGKSWKAPMETANLPDTTIVRPDMTYSPKGELAVMWLATRPDGSYTAWSAISHPDAGAFSAPLQVSHTPSPFRGAIKDRGNNWDGDDLSTIAADDQYVHMVWADGRAGFLGSWYARVPIASYQ